MWSLVYSVLLFEHCKGVSSKRRSRLEVGCYSQNKSCWSLNAMHLRFISSANDCYEGSSCSCFCIAGLGLQAVCARWFGQLHGWHDLDLRPLIAGAMVVRGMLGRRKRKGQASKPATKNAARRLRLNQADVACALAGFNQLKKLLRRSVQLSPLGECLAPPFLSESSSSRSSLRWYSVSFTGVSTTMWQYRSPG